MAVRRIEGMLHLANEDRYAILVGRFNSFVVEHLLEGAVDTLKRHGVSEDNITVVHAPGAWELPIVAKKTRSNRSF
jgi:6,7-dimethyl-8-ribityllumazine synthase